MDPASALGVGAGALQIFDFSVKLLLKSVSLFRSLRDAPQQILELSQDVDKSITRLLDFEQRLRRSDEPLVQKTSAAQLGRLRAVVSESHEAIKHLHDTLQRVGSVPTDSWGKKKWKAVVSVHLEQDIERHLRRIQRQDSELQRQLQLADLDINVDQSHKLTDLGSVIDRTRLETQSTNTNIQSLAQVVEFNQSTHRSDFEDLKSAHKSSAAEIIKEQAATKDAIKTHTLTTAPRLDLLHLQGQATQDKISGVSEATNLMRSEFQSFRNEMLSIITQGKTNISTHSQVMAGRLTNTQNAELNQEISKALLFTPRAIQQATDTWSPYSSLEPIFSEPKICNCLRQKTRWSAYKGAFGVRHESLESHDPQCRFRAIASRSWKYSLSVQLLPFLRKTVELTLGATFQGGESAIAPSLRVWNTVKRSEFYMFRLFDDFVDCCATEIQFPYKDNLQQYSSEIYKENQRGGMTGRPYIWDMHLVDLRLYSIRQYILDLSTTGICPWRIRDEYGNTLLHETIHLVSLLTDILGRGRTIRPLFELALKGGIDQSCEAIGYSYRPFHKVPFNRDDSIGRNIPEFTLYKLEDSWTIIAHNEILTRDLMALRLDEAAREYRNYFAADDTFADIKDIKERDSRLRLIQDNINIRRIFSNDENGLCEAVQRRDLAKVRRLLQGSANDKSRCCGCRELHGRRSLCALEFALGWPPGLRALIKSGVNPSHARTIAAYREDVDSLRILFTTSADSGTGPALKDPNHFINIVAQSANQEMRTATINYLRTIGSNSTQVTPVYEVLSRSSVFQNGTSAPTILNFMTELYDSGFRDIDKKNTKKATPLLALCESYVRTPDVAVCRVRYINWFLERNAAPTFDSQYWVPNILFILAKCFYLIRFEAQKERHTAEIHDIQAAIQLSLTQSKLTQGDACNCSCSIEGCLPLHQLLRCIKGNYHSQRHGPTCRHWNQPKLDEFLIEWLQICDATPTDVIIYCREAVRLEVFDRLGMTHVCCILSDLDPGSVTRPDQQTCADIRDEEGEFVLQLNLIMEAFCQLWGKNKCTAEEILRRWWGLLQDILPEPTPHRRCYKYERGPRHILLDERFKFRGPSDDEIQIGQDYINLDFTDVILIHFSKVLGTGWADDFMGQR